LNTFRRAPSEAREPAGNGVDDYAVVDGTRIGRIWRDVQNGAAK
jgi:hypothetical protein